MTASKRKYVVKVTDHAGKVQLLLRSESVNFKAECLMRANIIFPYIKQRWSRVRERKKLSGENRATL